MCQDQRSKILVVEDDAPHADFLRRTLESSGFSIEIVHLQIGEDAVRYLEQTGEYVEASRPDLVLLDLKLPVLSGHEVLGRIKANPSLRDIPIVVLTTSASPSDRELAYQQYANSVLIKSMEFVVFRKMISDVLQYWLGWNQAVVKDPVVSGHPLTAEQIVRAS